MFEIQNKIIIVDDKKDQLEKLGKAFFKNGLGCRTFEYSPEYDSPLKNVRIAFFDINLTQRSVDHKYDSSTEIIKHNSSVFNDLARAINQYIAKDNGPFALIFWTANKDVIGAFIEYVQNPRRGYNETPFPVFIGSIDKNEFTDETKTQDLSDRILNIINDDSVKFLFDFEGIVNKSSSETINKFFNIIPKGEIWGDSKEFIDNLGKVLSKLASSTLGFEYAKENPLKAVNESLIPLLNSEISKAESNTNWETILSPLFAAERLSALTLPDQLIQQNVNAIFHLDDTDGNKEYRGTVIEIDKNNKSVINSFNIDNYEFWVQKLLSIKEGREDYKTELFKNSKLIAIEISAACDFSNKKPRINKYILGLLTPIIDIKKDINIKSRIESSYHIGGCSFSFSDKSFQLWLNLNYVFGCSSSDERLSDSLFVLKKEIMDMIGNKYASHISRIGITSF
ncbi:hypothetical protein [Polaribacter vadi]|uniref:hypothetical protein n=1 Tax=Polaribacter vadi TaxID=1774273 RepID=UPI0030EEFB8C|tara:strand:- start:27695 stop:29053 length:1359 start_codon:yes stop_codon:yes gene_type:complete